jgi:ABC-type uncharacterized transport system permease subunit
MTGSILCITSHGWILYKLIETPFGQNLHWLIMLSFTLWLMNILTLISSLRIKVENLCILTYPLAALSLGLALQFSHNDVVNTKAHPEVLAHIFISLFAISILALAGLQAILLGVQNYLLKHRHSSPILRILPPLQSMEALLFHIIWGGMLFYSAALVTGLFSQADLLKPYLLPKTLLAFCAWILLTLLIVGRYFFGWRGKTAFRLTLSGTILAFLSYFGTKALMM